MIKQYCLLQETITINESVHETSENEWFSRKTWKFVSLFTNKFEVFTFHFLFLKKINV